MVSFNLPAQAHEHQEPNRSKMIEFILVALDNFKNEVFEVDAMRFYLCEYLICKIENGKKIKEKHELTLIVEACNLALNTNKSIYIQSLAYVVLQQIDTKKKI